VKRSVRLGIVEKLAKQREDQAAQALAQVRAQLDVENNRLLELGQYREEYLGYLDQQGALGISMQQWRRTQGFIDQLADLAQRQQITIDGCTHVNSKSWTSGSCSIRDARILANISTSCLSRKSWSRTKKNKR